MATPFERLGGEWALRAIINEFVEEMVNDAMIGFFFRGVDVHRLRDKEYEMTARFLGAQIPYTGKGLREAHAPHPIMGGQFDRRRQILVEAMQRHRVPEDVARTWLEHVDALRGVITRDARGACVSPAPDA
jgi:hemoglobin